jgi:hypothetical protein
LQSAFQYPPRSTEKTHILQAVSGHSLYSTIIDEVPILVLAVCKISHTSNQSSAQAAELLEGSFKLARSALAGKPHVLQTFMTLTPGHVCAIWIIPECDLLASIDVIGCNPFFGISVLLALSRLGHKNG